MAEIAVESEIAGTVWKLERSPGDNVEEEDSLMILESMKMEIPVLDPDAGKLVAIYVAEGDTVREGQVLATLELE